MPEVTLTAEPGRVLGSRASNRLRAEAREVMNNDGTVDQQLHTLTVNATPTDIPNEITIDVSGLAIGDSVRVGDLKLPAGVTTDVDPDEPVVIAQITRATIEAEQLEEEAAAAAEEAAAEAEGGEGEGCEAAAAEGEA